MIEKGLFVTIDGPNGVGKTSICNGVADRLTCKGLKIFRTQEPTNSSLGKFIRQAERDYNGRTLACLVAADRYFHLDHKIGQELQKGKIVLCARYVESSLVLQRFDKLKLEFIWQLNSQITIPDLSIILTAPPKILKERLSKRDIYSRFEEVMSRTLELQYYRDAVNFLSGKGFNFVIIENSNTPLDSNINRITKQILNLIQ